MDSPPARIKIYTLPLEIRDKIYQSVFAKQPIHNTMPNLSGPPADPESKFMDLLALPKEIRHQINRDVFHDRYIIPSFTELTFPKPAPSYAGNNTYEIGLLRTCKSLHHDALEFAYATLTFRVLYPLGTKETVLGPSQSLINRINNIEVDIDMTYYPASAPERNVTSKQLLMNIFYSTMFLKLSARESPGVACRVIFRLCSLDQPPWDQVPFFEALKRGPNFRTVTMELQGRSIYIFPSVSFLLAGGKYCPRHSPKDALTQFLERTMGVGRVLNKTGFRCVEFCPLSRVGANTMPIAFLMRNKSNEKEIKEVAFKEEANGGEESDDDDSFSEGSSNDDCFDDLKWRDP